MLGIQEALPLIPAFGSQSQVGHYECEASLVYIEFQACQGYTVQTVSKEK